MHGRHGDALSEIGDLRRQAGRLGILLPDPSGAESEAPVCALGHRLPAAFVWFCRHCPTHRGFPHCGLEPPYGLWSPLGDHSEVERRNVALRRDNPRWPAHWVSFWRGTDGDYCLSYDAGGHPWVVYWYSNYAYTEESAHLEFADDYEAANFVDWFAGQVEWALANGG